MQQEDRYFSHACRDFATLLKPPGMNEAINKVRVGQASGPRADY